MTSAALLALALLVGRPLRAGAGVVELGLWALVLAVFVVLPGWALARAFARDRGDVLFELGLAATLGCALLAVVFLPMQALGVGFAVVVLPAAAFTSVFLSRGRARAAERAAALDLRVLLCLALLAACVALRTPLFANVNLAAPVDQDLWFHAGNAAALARGFPLEDPRIAGEPLAYHVFSYVPLAVARLVARLPTETLLMRVAASTLPLFLLLQTFNAGRAIGRSAWAGVFAAAFVVLHEDVGFRLRPVAPEFFGALEAHAYLRLGIFHSPTTCLGLAALVTLALFLHRWFEHGARVDLVFAGSVGVLASGAKGSVMPIVLVALAGVSVWSAVRRERATRPAAALLVLGLASAPMTLWLAGSATNYARSMFGVELFSTARDVGFVQRFAAASGALDPLRFALAVPAWLALFMGLAGWIAIAALWIRRRKLGASERWLAACAACGLAAACVLAAPGESHLFFAYDALLAFALLAGAALANGTLPRTPRLVLLLLGAPPLLFAFGYGAFRALSDDAQPMANDAQEERDLRAGLVWIREHAPGDVVVVAKRRGTLVSVLAERSAFYETEAFSARHFALAWENGLDVVRLRPGEGPIHYVERRDAVRELFRATNASTVDAVLRQVDPRRPVWFLFDRVEASRAQRLGRVLAKGEFDLPAIDALPLEVVFENATTRICAVKGR
ncbi:MAG: hypothetical protein HZA53_19145 [Planctomycetes bacterium]|nr:hypothetical protein [Planctomycetota bacterium]